MIFEALTKSDNVVIAILSSIVFILSAIIVYQWKHTTKKTVPRWLWDSLVERIDKILEIQRIVHTILERDNRNK